MPPKAKRQASLPSQTAIADSKLIPLNSAPHQATIDASKADADAGTSNDDNENTDTGTSKEKQVSNCFSHLSCIVKLLSLLLL